MEQVLYKLPDGWEWSNLTDICTPSRKTVEPNPEEQYNYIGLENIESHTGKVISDSPTKGSEISSTKVSFKKGMVLYGKLRPYLNKVVVAKIDGIATTEIIPFECSDAISPDFLAYYLRSQYFVDLAMNNCSGARMPRATTKLFTQIAKVPVTSITEQKRIVEKLDALLSRIETAIEILQESVTLADAFYASSLDQVFEKVYLDYSTKPLSVLASKIGSGATPKGGQKAYKESGISLIRSLNVYDSEFQPEGLAFIDDDQAEKLSNVVVEEGDVLLNITGASIARCCVAPVELLPARVNQHVCIIRPNEELNSTYLNYLLISPKFKAALLFQGAGGATRQALTKVMVSNLEIPLPPVEMQAELVGKVNLFSQKSRALKEQVNSKISDLITLKASILDSAFKGEL